MSAIDPALLLKLNKPAPRYTSYPTAPEWGPLSARTYTHKLQALKATQLPLSLYFHVPFCKTMCLYCGCSVVLNRKSENEELYVDYLCKEIDLVTAHLGTGQKARQVHFGGGTPTKLSIPQFTRLYSKIQSSFAIDYSGEVAIEIDPRTVLDDEGEKLRFLRSLGFNRVSFGVQDTDSRVQEAVKRRQSLEMTQQTYEHARTLGFKGINIDLIYGLPHQTCKTFATTVEHILDMRPDRISLFSYAKVPWLKPHQKALPDSTLPSVEEKFQIYAHARHRFVQEGYVAIGMDHFSLAEDEIALAYHTKTLQRNFQGYSLKLAEDMLSFGASSIGYAQDTYVQNLKELPAYYAALDANQLPIHRGKILSAEDHLRKWVIHTLMCDFELDKRVFHQRFHTKFDIHFKDVLLEPLESDGLIVNNHEKIVVTELGELFVRVVAMAFDAYANKPSEKPKFSLSV